LIWPLVVWRFKRRTILRIAIAFAALGLLLRLALISLHVNYDYIAQNLFTRADTLLIGAACACIMRDDKARRALGHARKWLWAAPLVAFAVIKASQAFGNRLFVERSFGYTVIALAFACLLLCLVLTAGERTLIQRFFCSRLMRAAVDTAIQHTSGIYSFDISCS